VADPGDLEKAGETGHKNTGADQQHQAEHTPYKAVDGVIYLRNDFQNSFLLAINTNKTGPCQQHDPSKKQMTRN
jgi:hypothetical protein